MTDSSTATALKKKISAARSSALHVTAAHGHADSGDLEAALSSFNRALQLNPESGEALCGRSGVYSSCQKWAEAVKDATEAIRLLEPVAACGNHSPKSQSSATLAVAFYNRGNAKWGLGQWLEAKADCSEALRLKRNFPEALCCRASSCMQLGGFEDAIRDFTVCISSITEADDIDTIPEQCNKQRAIALYGRAFAFCRIAERGEKESTANNNQTKGWSDAVRDLIECCSLQPSHKMACSLLKLAQGRLKDAEKRAASMAEQILFEEMTAASTRSATKTSSKQKKKIKKGKKKRRQEERNISKTHESVSKQSSGQTYSEDENNMNSEDGDHQNTDVKTPDKKIPIDCSSPPASKIPLEGVSMEEAIILSAKHREKDPKAKVEKDQKNECSPDLQQPKQKPSKKLSALAVEWVPSVPVTVKAANIQVSKKENLSSPNIVRTLSTDADSPYLPGVNGAGVSHTLLSDLLRIEATAMVQASVVVGTAMALGNIKIREAIHREKSLLKEKNHAKVTNRDFVDFARWDMVSHGSLLCKLTLEKFAAEVKGSLVTQLQQEYLSAYMWDGLRLRAAEQYWPQAMDGSIDATEPWIGKISQRRRRSKASLMALALGNIRLK